MGKIPPVQCASMRHSPQLPLRAPERMHAAMSFWFLRWHASSAASGLGKTSQATQTAPLQTGRSLTTHCSDDVHGVPDLRRHWRVSGSQSPPGPQISGFCTQSTTVAGELQPSAPISVADRGSMASRSRSMISRHGSAQAAERRQRDQAVSSGEPTTRVEATDSDAATLAPESDTGWAPPEAGPFLPRRSHRSSC